MNTHFNGLTPAEAESLALLAEEAAEVVQIVAKILRHGLQSYHPDYPTGPDNHDMLLQELGDLEAAIDICGLSRNVIDECRRAKLARVGRYLHHATTVAP